MIHSLTRAEAQQQLPFPTLENPYVQVEWVWRQYANQYENAITRETKLKVLKWYLYFLRDAYGFDERLKLDSRVYLNRHWDQWMLYRFMQYLKKKNYSSGYFCLLVGTVQAVFEHAADLGLTATPSVLVPTLPSPIAETERRSAYSCNELNAILALLAPDIEYAQRVAAGYVKTGVGHDPRERYMVNSWSAAHGWRNIDNVIWYVENIFDCQPPRSAADSRLQSSFQNGVGRYHGGSEKLWRRLGLAPLIDSSFLIPLAFMLAWETGLNPTSLLELRRDCLQPSHPVYGGPYVRYYKERSTGYKELHLDLLDHPAHKADPLLPKPSMRVRALIEIILSLTERLVPQAPAEYQNRLFLVEDHFAPKEGARPIQALANYHFRNWWGDKRTGMRGKEMGQLPTSLNLARFRPTKITQMVREGYKITAIQMVAGHANLSTTYLYLDQHQLQPSGDAAIYAALETIYHNQFTSNDEMPMTPPSLPDAYRPLTSEQLIVLPKHLPEVLRLQHEFTIETVEPAIAALNPVLNMILEQYSSAALAHAYRCWKESSYVDLS